MTKKDKVKVGLFAITGCAGCQLSVIFSEEQLLNLFELVDLCAFPFVKQVNQDEDFDYVLMEGLVATNDDIKTLKKIRRHTKKLVALGACAHTGCIPAYRNFTLKKKYDEVKNHTLNKIKKDLKSIKPTPIDEHVEVDYTIPGCPPNKKEILNFLHCIARGIEPKPYTDPVCVECRKKNNLCLLEIGKPCLGPITRGGCQAVCPSGGLECWGCRGQTEDANVEALTKHLQKLGYSQEFIKERMRTFVGMKIVERKISKP